MTDRRDDPPVPDSRDLRLRAALRANLSRRKDQARARAAARPDDTTTAPETGGETGEDS